MQKMSEIWLKVMRSILIIFIFSYFQTYAQEEQSKKSTHQIGTTISLGIRNNEIFQGINYKLINNRFSFNSGINLGIKSSFFQRNFYPQLNLRSAYFLLPLNHIEKKRIYNFGPMLCINSGFQRIEKFHSFSDLLIGYEFIVGEKIRFNHSLSAGPYLESFKDQLNNRQNLFSLNFQFSIGLYYVLN